MIRVTQVKLRPEESLGLLKNKAAKKLRIKESDITSVEINKKSIDARKKDELVFIFQVDVILKNPGKEDQILKKMKESEAKKVTRKQYQFPVTDFKKPEKRPVIIGAGPAGLFCAYLLAENGAAPIIIERGGTVEERTEAVENFWNGGALDPECNVQFGEGGAGTFSDGKLNTLVKDPFLRARKVLEVFTEMGADPDILYEQKPHIGTDVLKTVIVNMRNRITSMGGTFLFHTKLTEILATNNAIYGALLENTQTGEISKIETGHLVLAIGHSARDTFYMLKEKNVEMHAKSFAVGMRIEHPQRMIQIDQYGEKYADLLPPAPYKITAKASDGRGVYSFCMCPGGKVVNASSEPGMLAVNGMSYHARDGRNANSAMIVTVNPEDFPGNDPLAGVEFQRGLEKRAYEAGKGKVPVQLFGDFKENIASTAFGEIIADTKGSYSFANLRTILPENLNQAFIEGIEDCGKRLKGFNRPDAVLSGIESRTSSPVKFERDESFQANIRGLFPCGEGAGYAGGITSAGMDGIRVAETLAKIWSS